MELSISRRRFGAWLSAFALLVSFAPLIVATPASAVSTTLVVNEIDYDQSGIDTAEFVEVKNVSAGPINLDGYALVFVNGSNGTIYDTIALPNVELAAGDYFVVCANAATVANCDLDDAPDTNFIQNGAPDAVAITLDGSTIDAVSYEGDTAGFTEGSGTGLADTGAGSISRCPDGADTDQNNVDLTAVPESPGAANICEPPPPPALTIMEIQGDGQFSPVLGQIVQTSGVVTAITANGRDAWIQDPNGDGDPATSDGLAIDDFDRLTPTPQVGDLITVQGEVEELQFAPALPLTRIDDTVLVSIDATGQALPPAVQLVDQPNESIMDSIMLYESLEGMRVGVTDAKVVGPTNRFGEFVMLTSTDAVPGSGYFPQTKQILLRSTGPNQVDYNPERIMVDDSTLDSAIVVNPKDQVRSLVGVLDYTFGNYKIQPTAFDIKTHKLPKVPVSKRSGPNGNTVITTFNVENLFDLELNTPEVLDSIGRIGEDPGSEWFNNGVGTQNETLRRDPSVCAGDADPFDPFDPSAEWTSFPIDTFDGLGAHTVTCGTASGLFISEYVEGSSNNKAVEIYNGTGAAINLGASNVTVQIFFNGSTTAGQTISLAGTLADGDAFVLANPSASQPILDVADQTGNVFFNGDDAVTLNVGGKDDAGSTPSPEELEAQLSKLALAIEKELELPEIMVLQEVENTAIAQELGDRVNAATGTSYVAVSFETSDGRGIEVAFLYDDARVDLLQAFQLSGPDVEAAFGPGSPSPGREPLYGKFQIGDDVVHIVGNHFKSKGGDEPIYGVSSSMGLPFERITEVQRKAQAQVVRDFVDNVILAGDPGALVMVTGDLNDFQFGEPGEGSDHPVAILEGVAGGDPLTNLIELEKAAERWTFVFDGNSQVLDHMLVNDALLSRFVAVDVLHFNAGFADAVGTDVTTTIRAADHDPVEGRFNLG